MADGKNRQIILVSRPHGEPTLENFKLAEAAIPAIHTGQILLKTKYLSLDPYMRGRMSEAKSYVPPFAIGEPLGGGTVSEVVASNNPQYAVGDIVLAFGGWQEYSVSSGHELHKLDPQGSPHLHGAGRARHARLDGVWRAFEHRPAQARRDARCRGGGGAGGLGGRPDRQDQGVPRGGHRWRPEESGLSQGELGFDAAVDHRSPRLKEELKAACPGGIDIYFENVGGAVWDAVFPLLNNFARVPVCGWFELQRHLAAGRAGPLPLLMAAILTKRLRVQGFIVYDFAHQTQDFLSEARRGSSRAS